MGFLCGDLIKMRLHYTLLLLFPLLFCSQSMASEQVLPEIAKLDSFKQQVLAEPQKCLEFILNLSEEDRQFRSIAQIINELPLKQRLEALDSILNACQKNQLDIRQTYSFFTLDYGDAFDVAPPNVILACNYYVPEINKLYQKAKIVFHSNESMRSEIERVLSGAYRKHIDSLSIFDSYLAGQIPLLTPYRGYWASLPTDKEYSFEEQSQLINEHAKLVGQAYDCLLDILNGIVKEEDGMKRFEISLDQLNKHSLEFEKLRPLKETSKQSELLIKYIDEITYVDLCQAKKLFQIADEKQKRHAFKQLQLRMNDFIYPDSYLLEWAVSLPGTEEERFGPKMKKLAEECKKTRNSSK